MSARALERSVELVLGHELQVAGVAAVLGLAARPLAAGPQEVGLVGAQKLLQALEEGHALFGSTVPHLSPEMTLERKNQKLA